MSKPIRKRVKAVNVRMTDSEFAEFQSKLAETGLSQRAYFMCAVRDVVIRPSIEITLLKEISKTFADLERQLRGLAKNVNQMAHVANGQGVIPAEDELKRLSEQLDNFRKESELLWRSIRLLIEKHHLMEQ